MPPNPANISPAAPSGVPTENYFDLLNLLSEVVVSTSDTHSILQGTVRLIQRLVSVQRCSILILDDQGEYLSVGAAAGIPEDVQAQIRVPVGQGIAGKVAETGEPIFEEDTSRQGTSGPSDPTRYSTTSFISVPIKHQQHTYGVINITNKVNRGRLDPGDLGLLQSVSRFLSLAMERHRLYEEAELLHAHLERTVESLPVGLLTVRFDGVVLTMNPTASRLLGLRITVHGESSLFDCFPQPTAHCLTALVDATVRKRAPQEREVDIRQEGSDTPLPVHLSSRLVETPADHPGEVLILIEDLSLRREVQELRRLDELKSNFIAMVSHELRTPLTAIRGSDHLLATYYSATLDETQRNLVRIIGTNTERLIGLVNNILDISLLDNQALNIDYQSVDLRRGIRNCLKSHQPVAEEKHLEINSSLPDVPILVWGDPDRLEQVIGPVLHNAVKFTPDGGKVFLNAQVDGDFAVIDVVDSGEGIPLEIRDKVFDKFFQGNYSLTRRSGGTGIGLYLARALAELHGGTIAVLETETLGAHIQIRLPLETSPRSPRNRSSQSL